MAASLDLEKGGKQETEIVDDFLSQKNLKI